VIALLLYVVLALGVSFLCSIMEAVLLSVTPSFVALHERRGRRWARRLRTLKQDVDRPLAAILSLNTIAHTVGAAGAGAKAGALFGSASLGVVSAVLTLLILVLSEIIPKTLGALYWRRLAPPVVRLLWPMIWVLWPLVRLSQALTRLLAGGARKVSISREEMAAMAEVGEDEGAIAASESRILTSLLRSGDTKVRDIMTPRSVVAALPQDLTVADAVNHEGGLRFSRIPVFEGSLDHVTGYVLKDEVLLEAARDRHGSTLASMRRELPSVPETMKLSRLFDLLIERREHIAFVVDSAGAAAGVVTLEDAIETLLGHEIVDEVDQVKDMRELARRRAVDPVVSLGLTGNRPGTGPGEKE